MSASDRPLAPGLDTAFDRTVPPGDTIERDVCRHCGFVAYQNPKIVVGAVVAAVHEGVDGILMCRRAIEPRRGYWTLPAGFMELGETPEAGAAREAMEEACAAIVPHMLLAVYSVPRIGQVQLIYRATLESGFAPGPESLDVRVFPLDALPWDELAFPSVEWALEHEIALRRGGAAAPFVNPDGETGERFRSGRGLAPREG